MKVDFNNFIGHYQACINKFLYWITKWRKFSQLFDIILIYELGHVNLLYTLHVLRKANFLLFYSFIQTPQLHFLPYLPMFGFTASNNLKPTCSRSNICKSSSMYVKSFWNIWGPNFAWNKFMRGRINIFIKVKSD